MLSSGQFALVDAAIALLLLYAVFNGWRQGAVASVLSTVGLLAGLICGVGLAPAVMSLTDATAIRLLLACGTIIMLVGLGNLIGGLAGASLRDNMRMKRSLKIDSAVGSVFQVCAVLIVTWLVAIPIAGASLGRLSTDVRRSAVLGVVDRYAPQSWAQWPTRLSAMLSDTGLPPLVSPFESTESKEVAAPKVKVDDVALVERLRPSVIHVVADADQCRRRLLGSGFVSGPDEVTTNAHVVAGSAAVRLDTVFGMKDAEVVYYNPQEDIAVLRSPGLGLPPLEWAAQPATTGEDAIVMGFPESGPFEAAPARIRDRITVNGPDIYASTRVDREAYTVRGTIRQGNSGGPMVDLEGHVLGVVFGAATDATDTGYVLTAADVRAAVGDMSAASSPVDTGACVAK